MIVEALSDQLPNRFVRISENLDKNFNQEYNHLSAGEYDRLLRIIKVAEDLPQKAGNVTDALMPTFDLDEHDKARVLELCAQMRKIVLASDIFDQAHRRRLLDRIAGIEYQVEQPKGYLDVVRSGVSDVGETLGKFGTDIKPLTDRMKEVFQITRKGSKEYEQIPAPDEIKRLPAPDQETEE
ncbi:hypothetical protein [Ruegeria profundi]|uniref:hypothetical protein n=1 Tax=Ruegeria profundi TaxID=1685378 RepID=UPI001CD1EF65|nr:hypothetical protein [Ruegeria profundi]MCA0927233.1 hypothetical protein [Ruegeria profundi]